jgi:hypothetical protein
MSSWRTNASWLIVVTVMIICCFVFQYGLYQEIAIGLQNCKVIVACVSDEVCRHKYFIGIINPFNVNFYDFFSLCLFVCPTFCHCSSLVSQTFFCNAHKSSFDSETSVWFRSICVFVCYITIVRSRKRYQYLQSSLKSQISQLKYHTDLILKSVRYVN